MLLPAFTMQHELQKRVLGRRYWMKAAKARAAREGISEDLGWQEFQKHITKKAFTKLVKGDKRKSKKQKGPETAAVLHGVLEWIDRADRAAQLGEEKPPWGPPHCDPLFPDEEWWLTPLERRRGKTEPEAPAPADDTVAPAPAAEEPADAAPAAPAAEDTAPAPTETAPAPAPAE